VQGVIVGLRVTVVPRSYLSPFLWFLCVSSRLLICLMCSPPIHAGVNGPVAVPDETDVSINIMLLAS
jgi:hypothetical protein